MAHPSTPQHQAGGGASNSQRTVKTVRDHMLPHLRRIFESHAGADGKWGNDQIKAFVRDIQRHEISGTAAAAAATAAAASEDLVTLEELDFARFLSYMTSSESAITNAAPPTDLSWPLSSYFISSSHNTYLSGNQLSSDSTTETYTNVLLRGCRCVEVDVWDGDESDYSSESSTDDEAPEKSKKEKKPSRIQSITGKLQRSLTSRFERTSRGKELDETAAKAGDPTSTAGDDGKQEDAEHHEQATPEVGLVEPRVLHGYTLTKEITFRDVCVAIAKSAFAVTDTPLIVSLEVHCSPAQQATMVKIMKETWADYLVPEPQEEPKALPSPAELRNKILIKVKYAPPGSSPDQYDSAEEDNGKGPAPNAKQHKPSKIIQELTRMGFYCRGVSFKSFTQPEASMPTHIFSLSETKFLDYHENKSSELWEHNKKFLMRAYPKGLRITSTNLNPAPFWGSGTQIVALNWQQTDEGIMLNEGMFAGTGGYVLKPQGYRPDRPDSPSPNEISPKTLTLTLTFLAAQSIPLPPDDKSAKGFEPYIKVELHVDASDGRRGGHIANEGHEREGEYKARTRTHKGQDIDLGGETLEFKSIPGLVDELTFVRFTVRDDEIGRDDLAAWACVRLDRLGEGYRFVHLLDSEGRLTEGVVLVKVEKKLV
ncbi:1-phosphatidylinositol 4,5-bisphosphate phosphodiesterase-like protein [Hapsidospora chrysogenum ATCC 11550]|uniref:Phosphoinositide phospholipase C n=1 Tax=Hapsidospora chrysogenum (strain ATCC 11550 / CBS 779.69 / DSM 880 / IAM 14645 / JCM 23072 / IMI 49137) TaxID=857340 RepID=A0A086THS4_HAPC1|nr:1-phosphatidylinositol 4,5-bisphosphate phosphodiesterase-like protein [Hapsidospora chrysogenum ATCC 11550]